MNKNILIKLFICMIFIILLSNIFYLPESHALGDIFSSGKDFLSKGNSIDQTINTAELQSTSNSIYNLLLGIAVMVAVIIAMILGIQFMAASADEKAKVKEALLPFIIGCVVVFGSFTIWKIVVSVGNDAEQSIKSTDVAGYNKENGKLYCDNCGDELIPIEQRRGKCSQCGKTIEGI